MTRYRAWLNEYDPSGPGGGGSDSTLAWEQVPKTDWYDEHQEAQAAGDELNKTWDWYVQIETAPGFAWAANLSVLYERPSDVELRALVERQLNRHLSDLARL